MKTMLKSLLALSVSLIWMTAQAETKTARIAVAANFTKTIEVIGQAFTEQTGHKVKFAFGPTGKLYAQIKMGAPFDAFFGADERRPKQTIANGMGLKDSYFVYAQGQLVLYSEKLDLSKAPLQVLKDSKFRHLALANPKTAPYGDRAAAFLKQKSLYQNLKSKMVFGESIAGAFQYVATGNAQIGFLAKSQVVDPDSPLYQKGYVWSLPNQDYQPINQGAVLTKRGSQNPAAKAFMQFMKTDTAKQIMERFGYRVESKNKP